MTETTEHTVAPTPAQAAPAKPARNLNGVKGWLLVLVIILGIGMLYNLSSLNDNLRLTSDPSMQTAFDLYPSLKSVLYFEIATIAAAIVAAIVSVVFIFQRRAVAKAVVTVLLLGVIVAGLVDTFWLRSILADNKEALAAVNTGPEMARAIVAAAIWIPYLRVSQRVKQTLTKV